MTMADEFNPYHIWLGIPPEEQPANHYRLLSLRLFETNGDAIDNAADRQMAHLRTIQVGKHGDLTQRLLNEVAAARICLLDPKKRAAYDQQLRAKLAASAPPSGTTASPRRADRRFSVSRRGDQRAPLKRPPPQPRRSRPIDGAICSAIRRPRRRFGRERRRPRRPIPARHSKRPRTA